MMKDINRRRFIAQCAAGIGGALVFANLPLNSLANGLSKYKHPVGFQVFPVREMLTKDFAGTMKMMADMGYQSVEMCDPQGYSIYGMGALSGMKGKEIRQIIHDAGLECFSCHYLEGDLRDNFDKSIEFAQELGLTQIVCPGLDVPAVKISDYQTAAYEFNKIAEKIRKAGITTVLHNHDKEFALLDGLLIYDTIMESLDANLVKMQFQTEVINIGYKASTYFNKYPGRFISAHLSDWTTDKKEVPIGQGVIEWKEFFNAAKIGGVKNFFVEMDLKNYKASASYLHDLLG